MKMQSIARACLGLFFLLSESVYACSIVGYIGPRSCKDIVLEGLAKLEYRGYDSAGFAWLDRADNHLGCVRAVGRLRNLTDALKDNAVDTCVAIGHTRWATHGKANEVNAHPHVDCNNQLAVVHNGIIENFNTLKTQLIAQGHLFRSATDTEVIAHIFEDACKQHGTDLNSAVLTTIKKLEGAYGFVVLSRQDPEVLVVVRKGSPVCIGMAEHEKFVASDALAFSQYTDQVLYLPDSSFALVRRDSVSLYDFAGNVLPLKVQKVSIAARDGEKDGYEHFMLKEIYEQQKAITLSVNFYKSIRSLLGSYVNAPDSFFKHVRRINIIACGTSWHAGCIAQFFFEQVCNAITHVHLASEFRYKTIISEPDSLYIVISQSGETADTLEALRQLNKLNLQTLTITNVSTSTMARETKGFLPTLAGPEVAVASTKAFTTQLTALYWLAHYIAWKKHMLSLDQFKKAEDDLLYAAQVLNDSLSQNAPSIEEQISKSYSLYTHFFFLGRHIGYPLAMEAALKLKEIAYVFASGYSAGELKHGSIALIDSKVPVVMISSLNPLIYQKLVGNAHEVKARDGHLLVVAFQGQKELIELADYAIVLKPVSELLAPIAMSGVLQLFAYYSAKQLGRDIDKPRNLAKSVTVE